MTSRKKVPLTDEGWQRAVRALVVDLPKQLTEEAGRKAPRIQAMQIHSAAPEQDGQGHLLDAIRFLIYVQFGADGELEERVYRYEYLTGACGGTCTHIPAIQKPTFTRLA